LKVRRRSHRAAEPGSLGISIEIGENSTATQLDMISFASRVVFKREKNMIETTHLTRKFGDLKAVFDLNLRVPAGQLFGFLGPNGAGKTTTIRMLVGLLRPSSGRVCIAGHDIANDELAAKRAIGYLAQSPPLYPRLTGHEYLRFIGGLYGLNDATVAKRAVPLLELMGLSHKATDVIESYSGGMRHKLALVSVLLHRPQVVILDEPLAGLDPASARAVKDLLRDLCSQGVTVFFSTHTLEIAERVCDRVGILQNGRLIADGNLTELRQQAAREHASLEDLFLALTADEATAVVVAELEG